MKLQTKIIIYVVIAVVAVGLVVSISAAVMARDRLVAGADSKGAALASALAYNARYGLATEDELMHQTFAGGARLVAMDKAQKIVALIRNGEKT